MKKRAILICCLLLTQSGAAMAQYVDDSVYGSSNPYNSGNSDDIYMSDGQKKIKAQEEARLKAEAEAREKARLEEEARLKAEAEAREKARLEEEARLKAEAEAREKARLEEEARLKAEVEAQEKARLAEEARLRAEAKAKAEQKAKEEALAKEKRHNNRFLTASITTGIVGGTAGAVTGTVLMLKAASYCRQSNDRSLIQTQVEVNNLGTKSRNLELGAWIGYGVGAAAVVSAVALGVKHNLNKKTIKEQKVQVTPVVLNDGAMFSLYGRW